MTEVERKLAAARTLLILEKPFLGALVLRLPLKESGGNWCTTSATDARSIYYHPDYIEPLNLSQVQFVLAHEALHCGLSHFARREHRDIERWNIACDHAVNPLLVEDGLELPPGALYDDAYTGLSAEEIYPLIRKDTKEETLDQHLYDSPEGTDANQTSETNKCSSQAPDKGPDQPPQTDQTEREEPEQNPHRRQATDTAPQSDQEHRRRPEHHQSGVPKNHGATKNQVSSDQYAADLTPEALNSPANAQPTQAAARAEQRHELSASQTSRERPPPLTAREREKLNTQWRQRLVGAAQQASQAGKMSGSVARLIDRLLRSTVPWRTLLARFMSATSRADYNIMRPTQRRSCEAILPSLHTRQANIVIALDTSGSIEQEELSIFVAEVNAIKSLINAKITLLACDWQLDKDGPWVFEPWELLNLPKNLQGGGGTDFSPVFDWLRACAAPVDLVIYFTDAQGRFPAMPSLVETLWVVKGSGEVPWGQRIQLN